MFFFFLSRKWLKNHSCGNLGSGYRSTKASRRKGSEKIFRSRDFSHDSSHLFQMQLLPGAISAQQGGLGFHVGLTYKRSFALFLSSRTFLSLHCPCTKFSHGFLCPNAPGGSAFMASLLSWETSRELAASQPAVAQLRDRFHSQNGFVCRLWSCLSFYRLPIFVVVKIPSLPLCQSLGCEVLDCMAALKPACESVET